MESDTYSSEATQEAHHWWFVGRRRLFAREIQRTGVATGARVLDAGTSTGTNLRLLKQMGFADVVGLDLSPEAIAHVHAKGLGDVTQGDICAMPFDDAAFDLVLATDIVEHVHDDSAALAEIVRVLKPGAHTLITVPAFPVLWGLQDRVSHHKRRYRQRPLLKLVEGAGLIVRRTYHFNWILFLPILAARRLMTLLRLRMQSEAEVNAPAMNWLMDKVFTLDTLVAPWLKPPFGVSILVFAQKPATDAAKDHR